MTTLLEHATKVMGIWKEGKMDMKEDGRLIGDEALAKNRLEMDLIKKLSFNRHVHQSVYNINTKGEVELSMPLGTPSYIANDELAKAKNHARYSKVARRLQMKLIAKGEKTQADLNALRRF